MKKVGQAVSIFCGVLGAIVTVVGSVYVADNSEIVKDYIKGNKSYTYQQMAEIKNEKDKLELNISVLEDINSNITSENNDLKDELSEFKNIKEVENKIGITLPIEFESANTIYRLKIDKDLELFSCQSDLNIGVWVCDNKNNTIQKIYDYNFVLSENSSARINEKLLLGSLVSKGVLLIDIHSFKTELLISENSWTSFVVVGDKCLISSSDDDTNLFIFKAVDNLLARSALKNFYNLKSEVIDENKWLISSYSCSGFWLYDGIGFRKISGSDEYTQIYINLKYRCKDKIYMCSTSSIEGIRVYDITTNSMSVLCDYGNYFVSIVEDGEDIHFITKDGLTISCNILSGEIIKTEAENVNSTIEMLNNTYNSKEIENKVYDGNQIVVSV